LKISPESTTGDNAQIMFKPWTFSERVLRRK